MYRALPTLSLCLSVFCLSCAGTQSADSTTDPAGVVQPSEPTQVEGAEKADLTASETDSATAAKARTLNAQALTLHREAKYAEAIEVFKQAVVTDTNSVLAQYNLACAYNMSGDRENALAELGKLDKKDCRACQTQLLWAKEDTDWDSARDDAQFKALVERASVTTVSVSSAAKLVFEAFRDENRSSIAELIHPNSVVKFEYKEEYCEENCTSIERSYGLAEFGAQMQAWTSIGQEEEPELTFRAGDQVGTCTATCCEIDSEHVSHGTLRLAKVCFETKAGVPFVSQLQVIDES